MAALPVAEGKAGVEAAGGAACRANSAEEAKPERAPTVTAVIIIIIIGGGGGGITIVGIATIATRPAAMFFATKANSHLAHSNS
jgi:hypothetical protein